MPRCRTLTHEDEPGAGQTRPLEEGVEHVLPLDLQLVQLVQHQQAAETGSPGQPRLCPPPPRPVRRESRRRGRLSQLATLRVSRRDPTPPPRQGTHTMGPWAVSCFSSLRTPSRPAAAGRPSCCATAGKMPCGLLSNMQFRTTVLLPASSSCQGRERYTGHDLLPLPLTQRGCAPPAVSLPICSTSTPKMGTPATQRGPSHSSAAAGTPGRGAPCSQAGHGSDRPFSRSRGLRRHRGCRAGARRRGPAGTAG